jgi:valyl-tRNA synthetase
MQLWTLPYGGICIADESPCDGAERERDSLDTWFSSAL